MKIKTFNFLTSNYGYLASEEFNKKTNYRLMDIDTPTDIDNVINNFIGNVDVIDIKINSTEIAFHNNSGSNKIQTTYTIMYKDKL